MAKQTSIEWLIEKYSRIYYERENLEITLKEFAEQHFELIQQAKQMHKEEIMMAVKDSWYMAKGSNFQEPQEEQYYQETYGGNNE